ncbi:protein dj-1beta-like isoform X2 [Chrysoperla carnea]|uniref:protein dj-1beta-like isoform X2 n=1 Tax=Chrysoperla carnea TaxID=189513 RepID=UPI001D08AA66|nr:protein dj-1beta-like isoform X2 [Chrysoperla carnea]
MENQSNISGAPCSEPAKPKQIDQPCPPPKMAKPSPTALIVIANGSEDMESVATADILRRSGVDVTIADIQGLDKVTFSNKVNIVPDTSLCEAKSRSFDAIILPGGLGGTKAMCDSAELGELLRTQEKENKLIGAICAAPTALQAHRIHFGKRITCYPSCKDQLKSEYCVSDDIVVIDGKLVTSQGPGTTCQFGLHLAAILAGKEKAEAVAKAILVTMEPAATA